MMKETEMATTILHKVKQLEEMLSKPVEAGELAATRWLARTSR